MSAQVGVSEPLDERYLASRASNLPLNQLRNEGYKRTRQMANLRCFVRAVCYLSPTGHSGVWRSQIRSRGKGHSVFHEDELEMMFYFVSLNVLRRGDLTIVCIHLLLLLVYSTVYF